MQRARARTVGTRARDIRPKIRNADSWERRDARDYAGKSNFPRKLPRHPFACNARICPLLLYSYSRDLTGSIGNIWRRWYLERGLRSPAGRRYETSGNLAAGMSASKRDAGAQTRKRRLGFYVENVDRSDCQVNPHRGSLTRHQPATRYFALIHIATLLLIANRK